MIAATVGLSPERLLRSGQGLWAAYVLQAALELGVFSELGRGPRTRTQLQRRLLLREPGDRDLLDALVGLGWLEREGDDDDAVYVNSREAGHYLDDRSPAALGRSLQDTFVMGTPVAAALATGLRGDAVAPTLPLKVDTLHAWAVLLGEALAHRLAWAHGRTLLGVGGGATHTVCALAAAQPHLQASALVPREELAAARDHIGSCGLASRVQAQSAPRPWPQVDSVLIHRWWPGAGDDDLDLERARAALSAGRQLLWTDHWLDDQRRDSAAASMAVLRRRLAGHVVHAETVQLARNRCVDAGFASTEHVPLGGGLSVVQAFV